MEVVKKRRKDKRWGGEEAKEEEAGREGRGRLEWGLVRMIL